jgi:transposase-like protein
MDNQYTCKRCHYTTPYIASLKRHLGRVNHCPHTYSSDSCEMLLNDLIQKKNDEKRYKCRHCDKTFKHRQTRYAHEKTHSSHGSADLAKQVADITLLVKSLQESLKSQTVMNANINNGNITNNNITINAFNKEDLSHITKQFLDRCVVRRDKGLKELVQKIHYDENAKSNYNLRISNMKHPFIQYHNGTKWQYEKKDKILREVIDKSHSIMQDHFDEYVDEFKNDMSETMFCCIKEWLGKMSEKDRKVIEPLLDDLYLLIINSST